MSHSNLTEDQVTARVREADAHLQLTPSPKVWERVEASLATSASPVHNSPLRVVHRANHSRMRTLLAVAACLIAVFGLTWFYASSPDEGVVLSDTAILRTVERSQLNGALELDGESIPLRNSLYDGVVVKVGEMRTDALQVCEAC